MAEDDVSLVEFGLYNPPPSLWALVESQTPVYEQDEIKHQLGESLVEQSLELHQEVSLLLEIWRDYRRETDQSLQAVAQPRLPEPPEVRDRLKKEIKFFVDCIREKSKRDTSYAEQVLSKQNQQVLDYALQKPECGAARPLSARSVSDGRETPLCQKSRLENMRFISEGIHDFNSNTDDAKRDGILLHLRDVLDEEVRTLYEDVDFLQSCLEQEVQYRSSSRMGDQEPTITDLREQRGLLERELLASEGNTSSPSSRPSSADSGSAIDRTKASTAVRLDSPVCASSKTILSSKAPNSSSDHRRQPLKAYPDAAPMSVQHITLNSNHQRAAHANTDSTTKPTVRRRNSSPGSVRPSPAKANTTTASHTSNSILRPSPNVARTAQNISRPSPPTSHLPNPTSLSELKTKHPSTVLHPFSTSHSSHTPPLAPPPSYVLATLPPVSDSSLSPLDPRSALPAGISPATQSDLTSSARRRQAAFLPSASPSHVTIRTGGPGGPGVGGARLVVVGTVGAEDPAAPSIGMRETSGVARGRRAGSAQRFRNMVLDCREGKI